MSDPGGAAAGVPGVVAVPAAAPPAPVPVGEGPRRRPPLWRVCADFLLDLVLAAILLVMFLAMLIAVIAGYGLLVAPEGGGERDMNALLAGPAMVVASFLAMLAAVLVLWLLRGRRMPGELATMPASPAYLLAVIAGVAIQAACLGIAMLASWLQLPIAPSNVQPINALVREAPVLAWVAVVLVAPLAEELMFRHLLLRRFALAGRALLGLFATALLFAAMHELQPWVNGWATWAVTVSLYAAMGLGFGTVYLRTGRFGAAFVAHATCNLLAMILLAFSAS